MKIHRLKGHIENIFIAEYPEKLLLLDGACRPDYSTIYNFICNTLKREISDLKLTVVTHMHPDHAGCAQVLRKKHNIPIAAFEFVDNWYSGFGGFFQHKIDLSLAWYVVLKSSNKFKSIRYKRKLMPDYKLKNKETLPFFSDWMAIHTPGHTSHDISIYNKHSKILYVADLLLEIKNKFIPPFPTVFPKLMKKSINLIKDIDFNKLYIAHGTAENQDNPKSLFTYSTNELSGKKKFNALIKLTKLSKCVKIIENKRLTDKMLN